MAIEEVHKEALSAMLHRIKEEQSLLCTGGPVKRAGSSVSRGQLVSAGGSEPNAGQCAIKERRTALGDYYHSIRDHFALLQDRPQPLMETNAKPRGSSCQRVWTKNTNGRTVLTAQHWARALHYNAFWAKGNTWGIKRWEHKPWNQTWHLHVNECQLFSTRSALPVVHKKTPGTPCYGSFCVVDKYVFQPSLARKLISKERLHRSKGCTALHNTSLFSKRNAGALVFQHKKGRGWGVLKMKDKKS